MSILEFPLRACKLISLIDNADTDLINHKWAASDTGSKPQKIESSLDQGHTPKWLRLQRIAFSEVFGVTTVHFIGPVNFANDFCRRCRNKEKDESVLQLLGICPALCQRRNKHLGAYHMDDFNELSTIDIGSLNRFIRSFVQFQDQGIMEKTVVSQWWYQVALVFQVNWLIRREVSVVWNRLQTVDSAVYN